MNFFMEQGSALPEQTVRMRRDDLDNLPSYEVPSDYSIRYYGPRDEKYWLSIHEKADPYNRFTPAVFTKQFGRDQNVIARRMCFLCNAKGVPIGTATAWFQNEVVGQVHWVAIEPEYQSRSLAKPLLSTVCHRLRELGHQRAVLSTDIRRTAAIHLYLKFGFVPDIRNEQDYAAWHLFGQRWGILF